MTPTERELAFHRLPAKELDTLTEVHDSGVCACGKSIVLMGNGRWRSTGLYMAEDRLKCSENSDDRHRPRRTTSELPPAAAAAAPLRRVLVTAPACEQPRLVTGDQS